LSAEQIIRILQQAERGEGSIRTPYREHGIAETAFYRWRQKVGGMSVSEAQRLRALDKEHARFKRLL